MAPREDTPETGFGTAGIAGDANKEEPLRCDYLVVGAGTAGMSFVDTMITEHPTATIVLVDRYSRPGGHWTKAYPFVRLHQPSCNYGVNSMPLGKHLVRGKERYDTNDRATRDEILEYYGKVCENFRATGRVRCFFDALYSRDDDTGVHTITTTTTQNGGGNAKTNTSFAVTCGKLVTVSSGVTVPAAREPLIPVHESVREHFVPPNEVPARASTGRYQNYIVFGCGKTGVDTISHLVHEQKVDPSSITWIISRDVWYFRREPMARGLYKALKPLKEEVFAHDSLKEVFAAYERKGIVVRLDPSRPAPAVLRGGVIDDRDLEAMRSIPNVVRQGRAKEIREGGIVDMDDGTLEFDPSTTLLVDCMVDNVTKPAVLGYDFPEDFRIFEPGRINLGPLIISFNPSFTSAIIAFLECRVGPTKKEPDADRAKNSHCFFLRGKHTEPTLGVLFGWLYLQTKTLDTITARVKGGGSFVLNSRTNDTAPMHHKGGLLGFLWIMFGPTKFYRFSKDIVRRIESKTTGWTDVDHRWGVESFPGWKEPSRRGPGRPSKPTATPATAAARATAQAVAS